MSNPAEEREHQQKLLETHQRRLRVLEQQAARFGRAFAPPHIVLEIEDIQQKITELQAQLDALQSRQSEEQQSAISTSGGGNGSRGGNALAKAQEPPLRSLRVFLCHASEDKPTVRDLYIRLQEDGFDPWLDEEKLLPGQRWDNEITKAVETSDVVLVCLSGKSTTKEGYIKREIARALNVAKQQPADVIFIIPVRLEDCDVPEQLRSYHWVNFFGDREAGYRQLVLALRKRAEDIALLPAQQTTAAPPRRASTSRWTRVKDRLLADKLLQVVGLLVAIVSCIAALLAIPQVQNFLNQMQGSGTLPTLSSTPGSFSPAPEERLIVIDGAGGGLLMLPEPNNTNTPIATLPAGTELAVIGDDVVDRSNTVYKHVRAPDGKEGWVMSEFVKPAP